MCLCGESAFAAPITAFYFTGSSTSFVAAGQTATLTPAAGYSFSPALGVHFPGDASPDYVEVDVTNFPIGQWWFLDFAVPQGQALAVGTYLNATRYPFELSTAPGLSFVGDGRGDNQLTGYFTILDITIVGGQLSSFAADFTQFDENQQAWWNYGSIRYNSTIALNLATEPSTFALLAVGLIATIIGRRRIYY
jgi:hypothetical protein